MCLYCQILGGEHETRKRPSFSPAHSDGDVRRQANWWLLVKARGQRPIGIQGDSKYSTAKLGCPQQEGQVALVSRHIWGIILLRGPVEATFKVAGRPPSWGLVGLVRLGNS
jgi:hypothetical protein